QNKELTIVGTVVSSEGDPLSNVSIYIKDRASTGTTTTSDGKFTINVVYGDWVVFTSVGYEPVEHLAIESQTDLRIELTVQSASLNQIVVVFLGVSQRKIYLVSAKTTVYVNQMQIPAPSMAILQ